MTGTLERTSDYMKNIVVEPREQGEYRRDDERDF